MYKYILVMAILLSAPIIASASETRLGFGVGAGWCSRDSGDSEETCSSQEFVRISIEQELSSQFSLDFVGDIKALQYDERFNSFGINLKYAFSSSPSSAYIKAGPHYYERREPAPGLFNTQGRYGIGLSTALGWQKKSESRMGYGAEVWYRTLDIIDAHGVSLFITIRI
ncbi:outer membrane beta-barrel protein [Aliidiomarina celeris]|uniref:outer membrane beta-barrel protein n=1 Tax=Aliidiomarina celeris TaxID=2249428 RepID=UPI000DE84BFD|nr:outer membrane beta-barrel protein [Aliidiomarina celeris]